MTAIESGGGSAETGRRWLLIGAPQGVTLKVTDEYETTTLASLVRPRDGGQRS